MLVPTLININITQSNSSIYLSYQALRFFLLLKTLEKIEIPTIRVGKALHPLAKPQVDFTSYLQIPTCVLFLFFFFQALLWIAGVAS